MIIRTNVKAGVWRPQHNEKLKSDKKSLLVKSGVKAGGMSQQHNEKLASDINTIKQKKSIGKKLRLSKETIRELKDSELKLAGGAAIPNSTLSLCATCLAC
jgi:hypothetical protein